MFSLELFFLKFKLVIRNPVTQFYSIQIFVIILALWVISE